MQQCPTCQRQQDQLLPEFEAILNGEGEYRYRDAELSDEYNYRSAELNDEAEIVGSSDTRVKINDTTAAPFRYICHIRFQTNDGNWWVGTGFFVGPKTILTAGHNIWDDGTNAKVPVSKIFITPARNGDSKPFGEFNPVNVVTSYAGFSASDFSTQRDYAIIHLGTAVGNTTGYFGTAKWAKDSIGSSILATGKLPLPVGQMKLNVCGYPGDKGGKMQYSSYNQAFEFQDGGNVLTYMVDTKGGQSGGPVWVKRDASMGGRVIVGVHIARGPFATSPSGTVKYNKAVFITQTVFDFIRANIR
jgi:glutamyl endopeptidase